jgi:hypothetical protein
MKVFVVVRDYGYDSYCEPIGVFSTRERAEEYAALRLGHLGGREIYEYVLDEGDSP